MATIIGYGSKHSHEFKLTVNETSTDVINNTSEISFSFTLYKSSYSWSDWNSITYTITINGTEYTGTIPSYSAGSIMTIKSETQTITHESDGKKIISCSFSVIDNTGQTYTCGNADASEDVTLSTIPRASTINSFYGNDIEEYFSVNYTSHYSEFTNKLRLSIPDVKELETFEYTSEDTFKLSSETIEYLYSYMKSMKTVKIGAVIETWNGSTKIGESVELTNTCTISNCEPTIDSASYLDSNSTTVKITGNNQQIVRNQSILTINLTNLKSLKGAILSKCTATINDITKSFSNITGTLISSISLNFGTLDISSNTKLAITLIDSRGYSITKELEIKMINYIDLSINATVKRTQPTTGEVSVTFSGNYYNGNLGNTKNELSMKWFYKEYRTSEWIEGGNITPVIKDNTYSNGTTAISLGKAFDYQKSYDFMLIITDKIITLQPTYVVTQGVPIFNWSKDFVNIFGTLKIKGVSILELIFPIGSTYITQENTNPNEILGFGTWERYYKLLEVGLDENDEDFKTIGQTGGKKQHILTENELPSVVIAGSYNIDGEGWTFGNGGTPQLYTEGNTTIGNGQAFDIILPYEVVGYKWIRRS